MSAAAASGNRVKDRAVRGVLVLAGVLLAGSLPALADAGAIQRAAALHEWASTPNPFVVPDHAWLLYGWAPVVTLSACCLFMAPGLLFTSTLRCGGTLSTWVTCGFAASLVMVSLAAGLAQVWIGAPLRGAAFGWTLLVLAVACAGWAAARPLDRPVGREWPKAIPVLAVLWLLLIGLAPKLYWEAFNGDGAHAFEASRLLLTRSLPFFPPEAASIANFPGLTSMLFAFPASWFIRLLGDIEASVRLPYLLHVAVLYFAVTSLSDPAGRRAPGPLIHGLLWLNLASYTLAMSFSATYSPYSADIALPATQDTLLMVCFLGFVWAFASQEYRWIWLFAALTYTSLPSGLLLLAFWLGALVVVHGPRRLPRQISSVVLALLTCVAGSMAAVLLIRAVGGPPPGGEYGLAGLLRYFAFLQFTDVSRVLYVAIPCGIAPCLALFLMRRQDALARALTTVTVTYFVFFYVQAYVSLHHFVPAMVIPLAVWWRLSSGAVPARVWYVVSASAGLVALVLSLPPTATIATEERNVGSTIEDRVGGYQNSSAEQLAATFLLHHLFPQAWDPSVPDRSFSAPGIALNVYASRSTLRSPSAGPVNYILQRREDAPAGILVAESDRHALYVVDESVWRGHLALRPPTPAGSKWLAVPRSTMFRSVAGAGGPRVFDMAEIFKAWGLDIPALLGLADQCP